MTILGRTTATQLTATTLTRAAAAPNNNSDMNNQPFSTVAKTEILAVKGNPYGLVYDNAITENLPGQVNIHPIEYGLHRLRIRANVYTPAGYDPAGSYPAIVVAHPNGGVKEQVSGLYAQLLAEAGFITLAFDAAYQGASGGAPRNIDLPANRIEDIHRAADILTQYPGVDRSRMCALGICSGGYDYYIVNYAHPNSTFRYTKSSLVDLMGWDASAAMELVSVPLLMIAGGAADTFYMTEQCFRKATGTADKELYLVPGATHIKTYYVPEYVEQIRAKLASFFSSKL